MWLTAMSKSTPSSSSSSYLVGAHLVDFAPCEMRRGLSSSGSILNRFVEGQQREAELLLSRRTRLNGGKCSGTRLGPQQRMLAQGMNQLVRPERALKPRQPNVLYLKVQMGTPRPWKDQVTDRASHTAQAARL